MKFDLKTFLLGVGSIAITLVGTALANKQNELAIQRAVKEELDKRENLGKEK